jgi:primosomal protein N' (replication factor Y)
MFAEVIINSNARALNKIFDYIVPTELEDKIKIGARVFVPFGNGKKLEDGFVINFKNESEFANKEIAKIQIEESLTEDNITLAKLMARKYFCNISECIKLMLPPGTGTKELSDRTKEKVGNFVFLKKDIEEIDELIENGKIKNEKHIRVLKFLSQNDGIYISDLEALTDVSKAVFKTLEKHEYIEIVEKQIERNPFINKNIEKDEPKVLNEEQEKCFNSINFCIQNDEFSKNLIYGITGSGKTEIYLQLIEKVLEKGKDAIVLVPEISLTPQMVDRFLARFGNIVAVLHSKLSTGERYDEWQKIVSGEKKIVIGARSAIFAPVKKLGIIIIDEEHDMSYKSDMAPRYNAKDLAKYIAEKNNCPLVLGSATPDITTMYSAKENNIALFTLKNRANNAKLPEVEIVDLRNELAIGNRSMLSFKLQDEINKNLQNKKQTILFLNRRGYSTFVMCRECGYVAKCKNCNISLTYHRSENKLKCHYCGYEMPVIKECPECNSKKVKYFGTGTQKLEEEVQKLFPTASTIRMDIDTVTKKNSHEEILNTFKNQNIDILIGTQMIVKGHHFPNVTLVGVITADSSLNLEDYRAVERTFQTLVQVAGRSGREENGKVIIQTYNPDHYAIIDSQKQNYDLFYNQEIELRKMLNYPPFCDIIQISFSGENLNEIKDVSEYVYKKIKSVNLENIMVYKPVPSPIDKIKNKYRWRIILKCKLTSKILDLLNFATNDENIKKCKNTRIIVDINPNTMN